uniref:Slc36a-2 n=1 Tax=Schmidtea mediterranea TaxID=79327 RepID=A0A0H3YFA5_SCHMD|nr:slc36a-2 [Schmidtea mediterranea]
MYGCINDDKQISELKSITSNGEMNEETLIDVEEDPHLSDSSNISSNAALMNLIKGNIGTGILAMPAVIKYAGIPLGMLLIICVGALSTYLTHILLRCAQTLVDKYGVDRATLDYTETVGGVFEFGPSRLQRYKKLMKILTNVFMIITQIGFCCAYMLFISDNIKSFVEDHFSKKVRLEIVGAAVMGLLLCMCWIKNLKIIARVAIFANISAILGIIMIMVYSIMGIQDFTQFPTFTPFNDVLVAFGIVIFAFEAINLVLPIQNKMKYPERYVTRAGVINTAMVTVVCLYAAMGFYGFLKFGENTQGSITLNLKDAPSWLIPIQPLFVFSILVSYLLQIYIPVFICSKLIKKLECHQNKSSLVQKIQLKIIPPLIVIFSYVMAISIPHLDLMLALLGAISSSYLALILPPIINVVSRYSENDNRDWRFKLGVLSDVLIFLFGLIGFIGGTASSIYALIKQ